MKIAGRIYGVTIALCVAVATGYFIHRQQERGRVWERDQAAAACAGDADAFENLRAATKDRSVALMEDFILRHRPTDSAALERAVFSLTNADERVRRVALARLVLLPEPAGEWLKLRQGAITNEAWRERLKPVALNHAKLQKQIAGFLTGLYSEHFHDLFATRRTVLQRDCHDAPTQLFFAYAPFDQVWSMLKNSAPDVRLRFLLLRLYSGREDRALEHLERFSAAEVLRVASQTWWPVEIEPLAKDGAYEWTTRASAGKDHRVEHLLRLSVRPAGATGNAAEWLHLDRWHRWTYLFRYKEPILNKDAVVFAEGGVRSSNQGSRSNPKGHREKTEEKLWLPDVAENLFSGAGRIEAVRGVPASARLPVVALSKPEELRWHGGVVFEWARPLIPAAMQRLLRFSPNEFPPPKVFASVEEAAQEGKARRPRARR